MKILIYGGHNFTLSTSVKISAVFGEPIISIGAN